MRDENTIHPSREQLADFVAGKLAPAERMLVESHVTECAECCGVLRSLPDETLIKHMRLADTAFYPEETQAGLASATDRGNESATTLPPELADHPRYRIVKQLGAGGMGVVYQAEHRLMSRPVALKVISRRLVNNREAIERFHLEVKAAAMLSHRNIVTAHDAEQAGDLHFLVMEFVAGTSLSQLVQQHGRLSVLHACNFVMQAAQGLQHASEHGMVHRDIKPQNLMRTPKGTIKILDFGLARLASEIDSARLTRADSTLGTADYIAPEQVEDSRHVDIRADIYSLGCTLYYLLAGHVPFPDGSMVDKILAHLKQTPRSLAELRPDIPQEVVRIVERMMAKAPDSRFQTPAAVTDALKPFGRPALSGGEPKRSDNASPLPPPAQVTHHALPDARPTMPEQLVPEQADLLDISFTDLPIAPLPAIAPPATRPRGIQFANQWIRYGLPAGILGVLVVAGLLLIPVLRDALFRSGPSADGQPSDYAWIDLVSGLDVESNRVAGQWRRHGNGLSVDSATSARLVLPAMVPEEYDFEVTFMRESGVDSVALFFVAGSGQATYEIDAWGKHLTGIQNVGGRTMEDNPSGVGHRQLRNGTRYTARVQVRRDRVTAYLDDVPIATYEGDCSELSVHELWRLPTTRTLGIGAYESPTIFHRVRVRPAGDSHPLP